MHSPLLSTVLLFFALFALASLLATLSYIAIMRTRGELQDFFLVAALFVVVGPSFLDIFLALAVLFTISLLCIVPASLERRLDGSHRTWDWYFPRLVLATYQSVVVGALVFITQQQALETLCAAITPTSPGSLPLIALGSGFLLTAPSISLLRWMWHTSKLRPGLDRPFEGEERYDKDDVLN